MKVEFIYDSDCPNAPQARENLKIAMKNLDLEPNWKEWNRQSKETPEPFLRYGSPTILINGKDVIVGGKSGTSCRLYPNENGGLQKVPSVEMIQKALSNQKGKNLLLALPAIFTGLLPVVSCPLCWPAYTAFLNAIGIGFLNYTPILFPLLIGLLFFSLFILFRESQRHRSFGPFILAVISAIMILLGKLHMMLLPIVYVGILGFVIATILNMIVGRGFNHRECK